MRESLLKSKESCKTLRPINKKGEFLLPFFYASTICLLVLGCSAGPPQIISIDQGIEATYSTAFQQTRYGHWYLIEYQDPDGVRDMASTKIVLDDGRFWPFTNLEPIKVSNDRFGILLRGISLTDDTKRTKAIIVIEDYAGNKDQRPISIEPFSQNIEIPLFKKTDANFTITGTSDVFMVYMSSDGREVGRKEIKPGQYQWKSLEQNWVDQTSQYYLQRTDTSKKLIVSSGPW